MAQRNTSSISTPSSTSPPTHTRSPTLQPPSLQRPALQQPQPTQSFRPLEYWKPPKAVRHIRAKSSRIFSPKKETHSFPNTTTTEIHDPEKQDLEIERREQEAEDFFKSKGMSFATIGEMAGRRKTFAHEQIMYDREDTLSQPWWNVKAWGKKAWMIFGGVVVVVLIIVIAVAVVVSRKSDDTYPEYTTQSYSLSETFSGDSFFSDNFDYFTGYDPTNGHVHYVPAEQAASLNLTYASSSSAVLRVDTSVSNTSVPNASTGRFSVRVTSKKQYGLNSLFIFDVKHSPIGCGTWPALWLTDPSNWPENGEIDVMEAVNVIDTSFNQMTLHTSKGCTMKNVKRKETGKVLASTCANTTNANGGCGVNAGTDTTFGSTFNSNGGGVLALELREAGIRMWQFARNALPSNLWTAPDPNSWGTATADFPNTKCDITSHFKNQSIVANIDLCGDWAGAEKVYGENCPGTCVDYVSNNNTAFTNAYWEFGNFSVFSVS
ncbi:concanavalin A-like lectin/glucanase domain-containing protein [Leptodontidium sp. 2 PMI_412]|nr:concanavalin A-like lectin/glucanase domain-containing protein [Leptodontidium sp. 2 PMI_412]